MFKGKLRGLFIVLGAVFLLVGSLNANAVVLQKGIAKKVSKSQNSKILKLPEYAPDRVIVKFKKDVSDKFIARILNQVSISSNLSQVKILKTYKSRELSRLKVIKVDKGKVKDVIRLLKTRYGKYIEYAEPDYKLKMLKVPNDPYYSSQWEWPVINAENAWDTTTGSSDIVVAVIDTGVDYNHPDLAGNIWENTAECNGTAGVDDDR